MNPAYIAGVLTGLALYFPACGGGGGGSSAPTTPPVVPITATDTADHYLMSYFPHASNGIIALLDNPAQQAAEWTSGPGWDQFGDSREFTTRRACAGVDYAYADGFGTPAGLTFALEAIVDRVTVAGQTVDLAQLCPGRPPTYLRWNIPAVELNEQWFWIHDASGARSRVGYWRALWMTGLSVFNPCWTGGGANPRPVLELRECWWDAVGGWVRCHPAQAGATPFDGNVPMEVETIFDTYNDYARDAGTLWRGVDRGIELCLRSS